MKAFLCTGDDQFPMMVEAQSGNGAIRLYRMYLEQQSLKHLDREYGPGGQHRTVVAERDHRFDEITFPKPVVTVEEAKALLKDLG